MKKALFIAVLALVAGNVHAQATKAWEGKVTIDKGGSKGDDAEKGQPFKLVIDDATHQTANFWGGVQEKWTFTADTYTWNDGTDEVTANAEALPAALEAALQAKIKAEAGEAEKPYTTAYALIQQKGVKIYGADIGGRHTTWVLGEGLFIIAGVNAQGARVLVIQ